MSPAHRRAFLFESSLLALLLVFQLKSPQAISAEPEDSKLRIVLIAGETALVDVVGHHDYLAGNACLDALLRQTSNIEVIRVENGWPADENILTNAKAIVFYTDGGGKQAFLETPSRVAKLQSLVDKGVGVTMIHQAVDFLEPVSEQAKGWLGGVYVKSASGRGHWDSNHVDFPTNHSRSDTLENQRWLAQCNSIRRRDEECDTASMVR